MKGELPKGRLIVKAKGAMICSASTFPELLNRTSKRSSRSIPRIESGVRSNRLADHGSRTRLRVCSIAQIRNYPIWVNVDDEIRIGHCRIPATCRGSAAIGNSRVSGKAAKVGVSILDNL
jgi:hypothetical protein